MTFIDLRLFCGTTSDLSERPPALRKLDVETIWLLVKLFIYFVAILQIITNEPNDFISLQKVLNFFKFTFSTL